MQVHPLEGFFFFSFERCTSDIFPMLFLGQQSQVTNPLFEGYYCPVACETRVKDVSPCDWRKVGSLCLMVFQCSSFGDMNQNHGFLVPAASSNHGPVLFLHQPSFPHLATANIRSLAVCNSCSLSLCVCARGYA